MTEVFVEQPLALPGSSNYEGDCRTAPATPGLLNMTKKLFVFHCSFSKNVVANRLVQCV